MEDMNLSQYIRIHSSNGWKNIPKKAGLKRCGKSCRLRWLNYLRPDIKHGNISPDEEELIIRFHLLLGNRWSLIAGRLPSRTDNEIKNYWNTHMGKKLCLSMNKSQPRTSENRRTRSKSPVPVQNPVFKSTTVKIKIVVRHCGIVRANGYNDEGCSNHISDEAFKLWNIQETIATTLHPMKAVPYHLSIVIPLNCLQSRTFGLLHSQFSSYSHIYVTSVSIFIYRTYL